LLAGRGAIAGAEEAAVRRYRPVAALGIEDCERVSTILRVQRFNRSPALEGYRGDSPSWIIPQQAVDVIGLVRAVESARSEVHDACARHAERLIGASRCDKYDRG
jgi:hypothetical protein